MRKAAPLRTATHTRGTKDSITLSSTPVCGPWLYWRAL